MKLQRLHQTRYQAANEFTFIDQDNPRVLCIIRETQDMFTIEEVEREPGSEKIRYRRNVLTINRTDDGHVDWNSSTALLTNEEVNAFAAVMPLYDDLWKVACALSPTMYEVMPFNRIFKIDGTP